MAILRLRSPELESAAPAGGGAPPDDPDAPNPPDPDADIVAMIPQGERKAALKALMDRYGISIYRFCAATLRDDVLADDIHQQVFIAAYEDLETFEGRSYLKIWLFKVARHRVLDAVKARSRAQAHFTYDEHADIPDQCPALNDQLDFDRKHQILVDCVAGLDDDDKEAVLLRYQQNLSYEEMSRICGVKANTLQARVKRALGKLRAAFKKRIDAKIRGKR